MANLDVQPKKKSILPWLLLGLGVLALIFALLRGHNKTTTTVVTNDSAAAATAPANSVSATGSWDSVNFNAPAAAYPEITNHDIEVRGNGQYAIYSLGEDVLFASDKATIQPSAEDNLKQVAASIQQRYGSADIRIYGHTDSKGTPGYNMQLAQQRAEAVRSWLVGTGKITDSRITLHPVGENQPVASNATAEGRKQNRRVEIVARNK